MFTLTQVKRRLSKPNAVMSGINNSHGWYEIADYSSNNLAYNFYNNNTEPVTHNTIFKWSDLIKHQSDIVFQIPIKKLIRSTRIKK